MKNAVLVTALWCPSCLIMRPRYQALFTQLHYEYKELDFDQDSLQFTQYNIGTTLPVCLVFDHGQEIKRIVGEHSSKALERLLNGQG